MQLQLPAQVGVVVNEIIKLSRLSNIQKLQIYHLVNLKSND